jgi:prepilin-type N-terminal cleavage/methylation domain-containing protein
MAKGKIKNIQLLNQQGFTLMEVMIAISIFAIFASVFVTGEGYNLLDSSTLKDEILLKDICENKINEIITNPPELRDSLTLSKDISTDEKNPNIEVSVQYKKFFVPDMKKIVGNQDDGSNKDVSAQEQMQNRLFSVFKSNMEKMIWQVEVSAKNKYNDSSFKLATWLYNSNADVQIGQF